MKKFLMLPLFLMMSAIVQAQTLDECQQAAERNYPLVKKYGMLEQLTAYTVENIQKGWLPQLSATAQASLQSDVARWPDALETMMKQSGVEVAGLKRDQYKVGLDVQQLVYDGGRVGSQKKIAREQGLVDKARNDVELYAVRKRVNELYFGLLLLHERKVLNEDLQALLSENERKLASMFRHGTAAESDYLAVKAERLEAVQQMKELNVQETAFRRMLSVLCGMDVGQPVKPADFTPSVGNNRPELQFFNRQLQLIDTQEKALDSGLLPRLSVFASGYYGYPGYNMFEDMMRHRWSLNGIIGARLTWDIGALYTRKGDKGKLATQRLMCELQREKFLFDTSLEIIQQDENIDRYRQLMKDDDEIIGLRSSVRKSAESKLSHGIIDTSELLRQINSENQAKIQKSIHETELLREIYNRKYTENQSVL